MICIDHLKVRELAPAKSGKKEEISLPSTEYVFKNIYMCLIWEQHLFS